jgi:hypothetical protein
MNETAPLRYKCEKCGWDNVWTRDQILQRGEMVVYRRDEEEMEEYSLPCQRPVRPACRGRWKAGLERKE